MAPITNQNSDNFKAVTSSVEQFCTNFYKIYSHSAKGNLVCSPLNVDVILAMLSFGAGGSTQKQLHDALQITINEEALKSGYGNLIDSLNTINKTVFNMVDKLFISETVPVKSSYLDFCRTFFTTTLEQVDFFDAKTATKRINSWCEKRSNDKIRGIVNTSDFGSETSLVLVSALYFKGQWKDKFDPLQTAEMPFYTDQINFKNVPMMKRTGAYNNGFIDELAASFIEIPYVDGEISLIIIMPVEFEGLAQIKRNIDKINITEVLKTGLCSVLEIHLPKFKIETKTDLKPILQKMGVDDMFKTSANFSNMSDSPVKVDKAVQKAFIVVNEEGSETAAVKSITSNARASLPKCFSINQPFVFQLVKTVRDEDDIRIALPLFVGVVEEPTFD